MRIRPVANFLLFAAVFLLPFGTRQIWSYGDIGGVAVEWGQSACLAPKFWFYFFSFSPPYQPEGRRFSGFVQSGLGDRSGFGGYLGHQCCPDSDRFVVAKPDHGPLGRFGVAGSGGVMALRPPLKLVYWGCFCPPASNPFWPLASS